MLFLQGPETTIYSLAFSPDGEQLAGATKNSGIQFWDGTEPGEHVKLPLLEADEPAFSADFSSDGRTLAVAGQDESFALLPLPDGEWDCFSPLSGNATAARFLSETNIVVGTGDRLRPQPGAVELWDIVARRRREPRFTEPHGVRAVATHPGKRLVAWATGNRKVTVWDVTKPDPLHFMQTANSPSLAFHPDGTKLAVAFEWGAKVYDLSKRRGVLTLKGHKGQVWAVAYSPDGRMLATASWDGTVRFWDPDGGAERAAFDWRVGRLYCLAFAPDGLRAAAAGEKGTVVVWDVE